MHVETALFKCNSSQGNKGHSNASKCKGQEIEQIRKEGRKTCLDSLTFSYLDCEYQLAQSSLADNVSCQSFPGSDA